MCLRKTTNGVDLNRNWGYAWVQVGLLACANGLPSDLIVRHSTAINLPLSRAGEYGLMLEGVCRLVMRQRAGFCWRSS